MVKRSHTKLPSERRIRLPYKGVQPKRGQGIYYDERKRAINLSLTPTAIERLEELGSKCSPNLSISEVVERLARGAMSESKPKEFNLS